jgi:hypothetical protein
LGTRRIVFTNRKRPHERPQEIKVDVRRDERIDEDYAAAMVANRTSVPLADVKIVRITA